MVVVNALVYREGNQYIAECLEISCIRSGENEEQAKKVY